MGKAPDPSDYATVSEPDPVAPASPVAKGSEEVAAAGRAERERKKNALSYNKTILSQGAAANAAGATATAKNKLGE